MPDELPPITDEVPENELEAGPEHRYLVDEQGEPEEVERDAEG